MNRVSLFEQVGGLPVLEQVHRIFYDKVYANEWLGQFFKGHDQVSIERRQTQFMAEKMGGELSILVKPLRWHIVTCSLPGSCLIFDMSCLSNR